MDIQLALIDVFHRKIRTVVQNIQGLSRAGVFKVQTDAFQSRDNSNQIRHPRLASRL